MPVWLHLTEWAQALGFDVVLQRRETTQKTLEATKAKDSHVRERAFSMFG
jgi:hypothetical protein